jgi:hypothetical protein
MLFVVGNEEIHLFLYMNILCHTFFFFRNNVKIFSVCDMYTLCVKLNYINVGTATNDIMLHVGHLK